MPRAEWWTPQESLYQDFMLLEKQQAFIMVGILARHLFFAARYLAKSLARMLQ